MTDHASGAIRNDRNPSVRAERIALPQGLAMRSHPRGEAPAQVSESADRLSARLRTPEDNIAIFSHGHFGRPLAARWIELQVGQAQHSLLITVLLSVLGYEHTLAEELAIVLWNAVSNDISTE